MKLCGILILLLLLPLVVSGCASRFSHGELHYIEEGESVDDTFEAVRAAPSSRVLYCDPALVEDFVDLLEMSAKPGEASPPMSSAGAVLLAVYREEPQLGHVMRCWVSEDGTGGEIGFTGRSRSPHDGHIRLVGTWFYWTPELVDAWNDMLASATPHKPE